jgi:flagellar motor protein MotB
MLVLAVAYAWQRDHSILCRNPDNTEAAQLAANLRNWSRQVTEIYPQARSFLDHACIDHTSPPPIMPAPTVALPRDICPVDAEQILANADLSASEVDHLQRNLQALAAATAQCKIAGPDCDTLDASETRNLAARLRHWRDAMRRQQDDEQTLLDRSCPGWSSDEGPSRAAPTPPGLLNGLCKSQAETVLREANIDSAELNSLTSGQTRLANALLRCIPRQETITISEAQLHFQSCKAEIGDDSDFFLKKALQIQNTLRGSDYNRIDVFGHTDNNPISTCVVSVHRDNYSDSPFVIHDNVMLSMLRADAFLNKLLSTIRAHGDELAELNDRINNHTLRFYAIGVGDAELQSSPEQSRRIEIRFVRDRRAGG